MQFSYDFEPVRLVFGQRELHVESARSFTALDAASLPTGRGRMALPLGATIWPSALVMGDVLGAHEAWIAGRDVLEIGCGAGVVSILATLMGGRVTASDGHPDMGGVLARNAASNHVHVDYQHLDWNQASPLGRFSTILAADVLYEPLQCNTVLDVLERHLALDGVAVLVDPGRQHLTRFRNKAAERGFQVEDLASPDSRALHPEAANVFAAHEEVARKFVVLALRRA